MSAADLTSRVTSLLGGEGGILDAEALLADLSLEKSAAEADAAATHVQAIDIATPAAQAVKLNARVSQLSFEAERLGRQEEAVSEHLDSLRAEEREATAASERAAAVKERDQLAADLANGFPAAIAAIIALLDRLTANGARLRAIGINPEHEGAEAKARGFVPDCGGLPAPLAFTLRLPDLRSRDREPLWPRRERVQMWTPPPVPLSAPLAKKPGAPAFAAEMEAATASARRDAASAPRFPIDVTPPSQPLG